MFRKIIGRPAVPPAFHLQKQAEQAILPPVRRPVRPSSPCYDGANLRPGGKA
jgi:hypothetical protein